MASTLTCIDSSDDTIFSKFCDINPSYSTTFDNGERFCNFQIPISCFDPPLGCVYIIYQDTNEVYVGKTYHLGDRFHKYANSWDWDSTDIRTDHAANINKKILAGAEAGHCFKLWISPIKDESERVVIEKNTIWRYKPAWNIIMYEGETRELDKCECIWSFVEGFNIPLRSYKGRLGDHCTWCKKYDPRLNLQRKWVL